MAAPEESPSASVQALRSAHDPTTILVVLAGSIARSDARRLAERVQALLEDQPASTLICDVAGILRSDALVVDALCRIRVMALRHGCRVTIQDPPRELEELLYLTGLTNVLRANEGQACRESNRRLSRFRLRAEAAARTAGTSSRCRGRT